MDPNVNGFFPVTLRVSKPPASQSTRVQGAGYSGPSPCLTLWAEEIVQCSRAESVKQPDPYLWTAEYQDFGTAEPITNMSNGLIKSESCNTV